MSEKVKAKAPPTPKPVKEAVETVSDKASEAVDDGSLKRLAFVKDAAVNVASAGEQVYVLVRPFAPTFVEPLLTSVEDKVTAYGAPVVNTATDVGDKLLKSADSQVDYYVKAVGSGKDHLLNTNLDGHIKTIKQLTYTSLAFFIGATAFVLDAINPVKNIERAKVKLGAALQAADKAADPDKAVQKVQETWDYVAAIPAVNLVLTKAEPITKVATSSFVKAHDTVVTSSYYKRAFDFGTSTLSWATTTTPYKLSTKYVYPWVEPVAAPALEKINGSKSVDSAISYWKPAASV